MTEQRTWPWRQRPLRVSADGRYLEDDADSPFFYLADTAWFAIYKGSPEQWERYLDLRAAQGYSVIQVQLLPFRWEAPDPDGNHPFLEDDVSRPNDAYFERAERFCRMAADRGLYVCLFLIWMNGGRNQSSHFTTEQAAQFARYAVRRFGRYPVLWSISGDGPYVEELEKWEAVGRAVEETDVWRHPTTNHLLPRMNWHFLFHASAWHDFHMFQTGHGRSSFPDIAALPAAYRALAPRKPALNGEPPYEGHPERIGGGRWGPPFTPAEVRFAFWTSILSGTTMGHTYGGQGVWNWKVEREGDEPVGGPGIGPVWSEAMRRPGAAQCGVGAEILRGLAWWRLRPAPERVQVDPPPTHPNGAARCASSDDTWVVYLPGVEVGVATRERRVAVKGLAGVGWRATWVDPISGEKRDAGGVEVPADLRWWSPASPSDSDWVLILTK